MYVKRTRYVHQTFTKRLVYVQFISFTQGIGTTLKAEYIVMTVPTTKKHENLNEDYSWDRKDITG